MVDPISDAKVRIAALVKTARHNCIATKADPAAAVLELMIAAAVISQAQGPKRPVSDLLIEAAPDAADCAQHWFALARGGEHVQ